MKLRKPFTQHSGCLMTLSSWNIRMLAIDGIEATKRIRSSQSPTAQRPVLALMANAMVGDKEDYLAAGMTDYISKPIDFTALLSKIESYFGERRAAAETSPAAALADEEPNAHKQRA